MTFLGPSGLFWEVGLFFGPRTVYCNLGGGVRFTVAGSPNRS